MQTDQPEGYDPYNPPARPPSAYPYPVSFEPYAGIQPIPSARRGLVTLFLITALVLAGGGVGTYFFIRWLDSRETAGQVDVETAIARDHPSTLHAVDKIDNLRRVPLKDKKLETAMINAIDGKLGRGNPFVLTYADPAAKTTRGVMLIVGTTQRIEDPLGAVLVDGYRVAADVGSGKTILGAGAGDSTLGEMRLVDAGPPGGMVLCAPVLDREASGSVCAWSDFGSRGVAAILGVSVPEAARTLARVRSAIIVRPTSKAN